MSRTETRLEQHRTSFREARGVGPLIQLEELDPDEIALINAEFLEHVRRMKADDIGAIYDAYIETLHRWGVMCPHPQRDRLYDGWCSVDTPVPFEESRWYSCRLCNAIVINRS